MKRFINLTTWLIIVLALLLWGMSWGRMIFAATSQPSPAQKFSAQSPVEGVQGRFSCTGDYTFNQGDRYWLSGCLFSAGEDPATSRILELDLTQDRQQSRWLLPQNGILEGIAPDGQGNYAAILQAGDATWGVYLLRGDGTVDALGLPTGIAPDQVGRNAAYTFLGLAWQAGNLEVVSSAAGIARIDRYTPGVGWLGEVQRPFPTCGAETICRLEAAYPEAGGWRFLYSQVPAALADPNSATLTLWLGQDEQAPQAVQTLTLIRATDQQPGHYTVDEVGGFLWLDRTPFDQSRGNMVGVQNVGIPFLQAADGSWQPLPLPSVPAEIFSFLDGGIRKLYLQASYELGSDRLRWLPRLFPLVPAGAGDSFIPRGENFFYREGRWFYTQFNPTLVASPLNVGEVGQATRLVPTTGSFGSTFGMDMLRSMDGGWWVVWDHARFVRLGADLQRLDSLGFTARWSRLFENFDEAVGTSGFFGSNAILKQVSFYVLLFALPLGILLGLGLRAWARDDENSAFGYLWPVCLTYVTVALLWIEWFWTMTESF
jgi:hypothetical protein